MNICEDHTILLSAGGAAPAIYSFDTGTLQETRVHEFPARHTPYGIGIDPLGVAAAAGTRAGRVLRIPYPCPPNPGNLQTMIQGAPVLSVGLLDSGLLVSCDTAWRTLLWKPGPASAVPDVLDSEGHRICSLMALPDGNIAGLSTEGAIRIWDPSTRRVVHTVQGPRPPELLALVHMAYWAYGKCVVYAAAGGYLALFNPDTRDVVTRKAHRGDFYVVIPGPDMLYTVGTNDGLIKAHGDSARCTQQWHAPKGIVSGACVSLDQKAYLLIDQRGSGAVYGISSGSLQIQGYLHGSMYRTVCGLSLEAQEAYRRRQRKERARQVGNEIQQQIQQGRSEGLKELYQELSELGYPETSLVLRADMADRQQDIPAELQARHALSQTGRQGNPESLGSLSRYAELLEGTWQLREAQMVYERLSRLPDHPAISTRLAKAADILAGQDWIAQPDVPMQTIFEASNILGKPLTGRWLLGRRGPIPWPLGRPTGEIIAAKYEQLRTRGGPMGLPHASAQLIWWISAATAEQIDTVLLTPAVESPMPNCQLAVQVCQDGAQVVLIPTIILDLPSLPDARDFQEHNQESLNLYQRVSQTNGTHAELDAVTRLFMQAVRHLHTEALNPYASHRKHDHA